MIIEPIKSETLVVSPELMTSMTFFTSWILSLYVFDISINLVLSIYDFLDLNTRVSPSVTIIVSVTINSNVAAIKYP
jgi:hypothetical protein